MIASTLVMARYFPAKLREFLAPLEQEKSHSLAGDGVLWASCWSYFQVVPFLAVLREIQALNLVLLWHAQAHQ